MFKQRAMLTFAPGIVTRPITYNLIRRFDVVVNILQAKVFPEEEGQLIVELENARQEHIDQAVQYLKDEGVVVEIITETVRFDQERCMHCGACTGVCRARALTMDEKTWKLMVEHEKCFLCELCVQVCPVKALSLHTAGLR